MLFICWYVLSSSIISKFTLSDEKFLNIRNILVKWTQTLKRHCIYAKDCCINDTSSVVFTSTSLSEQTTHPGDRSGDQTAALLITWELQVGSSDQYNSSTNVYLILWSNKHATMLILLHAYKTCWCCFLCRFTVLLHGDKNTSLSYITLHMMWVCAHTNTCTNYIIFNDPVF